MGLLLGRARSGAQSAFISCHGMSMYAADEQAHQPKPTEELSLAQEAIHATPPASVAALVAPTAVESWYSRPDTNTVLFWHAATVVRQRVPSKVVVADVVLSTAKVITPPASASGHREGLQ